MIRPVILENNQPKPQFVQEDYDMLALSDFGKTYLIIEKNGCIGKLHKEQNDTWSWIMLNNSVGRIFNRPTMEEALTYAIECGDTIVQLNLSDLLSYKILALQEKR